VGKLAFFEELFGNVLNILRYVSSSLEMFSLYQLKPSVFAL